MNPFDIVVVVIVCFCLIRGAFRGLVKELSGIVGVLAGYYGANTYYPQVAAMMSGWISDESICNIVAYLILFSIIFIGVSVLGIVVRYLLNAVFSGWVDRIGGALFGLLKGGLIAAVIFIALTAFLPKGTSMLQESRLSPYVGRYAEIMAEVVSEDMKDGFQKKFKELKKSWGTKKR